MEKRLNMYGLKESVYVYMNWWKVELKSGQFTNESSLLREDRKKGKKC